MKTAIPALISHLASAQQLRPVDLLTISLISGHILRYTAGDANLLYNGNTFYATGPAIKRSSSRISRGLEVQSMNLEIYPRDSDMIAGITFLASAVHGGLDGGSVLLERAFLDSDAVTVIGGYINFSGLISDLDITRGVIGMTVNAYTDLLNANFPRNLYQPGCQHTLYDADCELSRASWRVAGTVLSGSTSTSINASMAQALGWFDLGYIYFPTGSLAGTKRTVRKHTSGNLALLNPLPAAPLVGESFDVYPGCDKLKPTCENKFLNLIHFKGFPYIPNPESAI